MHGHKREQGRNNVIEGLLPCSNMASWYLPLSLPGPSMMQAPELGLMSFMLIPGLGSSAWEQAQIAVRQTLQTVLSSALAQPLSPI